MANYDISVISVFGSPAVAKKCLKRNGMRKGWGKKSENKIIRRKKMAFYGT